MKVRPEAGPSPPSPAGAPAHAPGLSPVAPQRVDTASGPWPLHASAAARAAEQAALAALAPSRRPPLMEQAGLAVARLALAVAPHARRVRVWAGPGNNGGDGLVAARHLHAAGRTVEIVLLADATRLPPDAVAALQAAQAAGVLVGGAMPGEADAPPELAIDALLGLGASRAPAGAIAAAIAAIDAQRRTAPVLAVDLPSGLHPDTGAVLGDAAVRADWTLSLLTLKPGCYTAAGRDHAGQTWLATLGVGAGAPTAWLAGPPARLPRAHASHKGSHGDVAVVGGAPGMAGAAWLAARAALAAGAGRVYCSLLDEAAALLDPARPELMGRRRWWLQPPAVLSAATVACGCGGGEAVAAALPPLLAHARRLVLDADALNALAGDAALRPLLERRAARGLATVLTPHPLEAARLLGCGAVEVQRDRVAAATELAARCGSTVLLKGSGSIVAAPGSPPTVNPTGSAALATAGTGDVLAGWLAGLWAQQPAAPAQAVAAAAAWQHGRAADVAAPGAAPLRAADLVDALAALPR